MFCRMPSALLSSFSVTSIRFNKSRSLRPLYLHPYKLLLLLSVMYLWYYSTRAFARNSFHATRPEIHGARQICIQSYNINNVFLHFIISRRIHAAFCTVIVFVSAALYSEASGLQPTKYAVRPVFWNILIIFSTCWNVPGSTAYKIRRETRNFTFPGLTAYFLLPVPKSHGFIPLFLSYQAVFGSHAAIFPL